MEAVRKGGGCVVPGFQKSYPLTLPPSLDSKEAEHLFDGWCVCVCACH